MATIEIRLFETTAFSNPSAVRKKRKQEQQEKKSKKRKLGDKPVRIGQKSFLALSDKEKKRYLEHFPKSSHRRLLQSKTKPTKDKEKPVQKKNPASETPRVEQKETKDKLRKMTRDEFEKLSKKQQKEYKKRFPKNSFKGKKHFVEKKTNAVQKKKKGDSGETIITGDTKSNAEKNDRKSVKAERDEAKRDLRHGVTQEAVDALKNSTAEDLKNASDNLKKNRKENVKQIKRTLTKRPEFVTFDQKDIEQAQKALKREAVRDDTTWNNRDLNRTKKLIESLKNGETRKLTDKERELLGRVSESKPLKKEPFWKRDLKVLKGFVTGERIEPEGRSNAMLALAVVARYALIAGGVAALSMGAAPAALHVAQTLFGQWDGFTANASAEDDDIDGAIELAYDAVADLIGHMDHEEFVQSIDETFLEFRAKASNHVDLRSVVFRDEFLSSLVKRASASKVSLCCDVAAVVPRVEELVSKLGYVALPDGTFSQGDNRIGVYQSSLHTVDLLALPSPSDIVHKILEA